MLSSHVRTRTRSRRDLLKLAAGTAAGAAAAAGRPARAQDASLTPTPEPVNIGQGATNLTIWVQDFGPTIGYFEAAARAYVDRAGADTVQVTVQALPFDDLLAKVLPSVAGGTEADIIMGYTNWYVATDVSRLFLPLGEYMGGRATLEESVYPTAFGVLDTPGDEVYYVPFAAGLRGAATTVNLGQYEEQGIDPLAFTSWDEVEAAAEELTIRDGDAVTRAGLSPIAGLTGLVILKQWIWQQGGEFYDRESGTWSLASPEGEAAMQRLYDLFWTKKVSSFDLINVDTEFDDFNRGAVSTHINGAWAVGFHEQVNPDLDAEGMPTPVLAGGEEVYYPDHLAVTTLSRRLAEDETKLPHALGILEELLTPDALLAMTETYTGSLLNQKLYEDPRIEETRYGPASKRIAQAVWPKSRFPGDRVANFEPAQQELERALRQELAIMEALQNADAYLNDQEAQVRQRMGG